MSVQLNYGGGRGRALAVLAALLAIAMAGEAVAELEQVSVNAEMRIRGRWYINAFNSGAARQLRMPNSWVQYRPLGTNGVSSIFGWDHRQKDWSRYETATKLGVTADFSNNVSAMIEFYDWGVWGEDFRSSYVTGVDTRANSMDDVEVEQAYIEAKDMFGTKLSLRVGRQELILGKGWLVNNLLTPSQFSSHDAVRLTYADGPWTVDAIASKPFESQNGDNDQDFYTLYGTYAGWTPLTVSAYWMYLRDGVTPDDNPTASDVTRWGEKHFGVNQYDNTELHTFGTRLFGKSNGFDYDLELAYQLGDAAVYGSRAKPLTLLYGDDDAHFGNLGAELTAGYTFADAKWSPRPYLMGVYFQGHDNRDINFWDMLNPFYRPNASVSFNRLYSDKNYMPTINDNGWLSNVAQAAIGVTLTPSPKLKWNMQLSKDWAVAPFDFPVVPGISWWTKEGSDDLGWEFATWLKYDYTKDIYVLLYGNYLWTGDGLTDGAYIQFNGTDFCGGSGDDNAGYLFWMTVMKF